MQPTRSPQTSSGHLHRDYDFKNRGAPPGYIQTPPHLMTRRAPAPQQQPSSQQQGGHGAGANYAEGPPNPFTAEPSPHETYLHLDGSLRSCENIPQDPQVSTSALERGCAIISHSSNRSYDHPFHPEYYLPGPGSYQTSFDIDGSYVVVKIVGSSSVLAPESVDGFVTHFTPLINEWLLETRDDALQQKAITHQVTEQLAPVLAEIRAVHTTMHTLGERVPTETANNDSPPLMTQAQWQAIADANQAHEQSEPDPKRKRPSNQPSTPTKNTGAARKLSKTGLLPKGKALPKRSAAMEVDTEVADDPEAEVEADEEPTPDRSSPAKSTRSEAKSVASQARDIFLKMQVNRHLEAELGLSSASRNFIEKLFKYIGKPECIPDKSKTLKCGEYRTKAQPILASILYDMVCEHPSDPLPIADAIKAYKPS